MSFTPKSRTLAHLLAVLLTLPLLCACSSKDDVSDVVVPAKPEIATSNHYINLSIVVSSGNEGTMRVPTGDSGDHENGDDEREDGLEEENKVTGITFMLYPITNENDGINKALNTKLAFVQYYPVKKAAPEECDYKDEAVYTTGIQPLKGLDLSASYRAIVVANRDLTDKFYANVTTVEGVCKEEINWIYIGTGIGVDARSFVMSSENDGPVIKFTTPSQTPPPTADGETSLIYEPEAIHIERLAARVDFWMNNAVYAENSDDESLSGYKYPVYKSETGSVRSEDYFILTAVTPFNLYNNNTASEFLLKKLRTGVETPQYLVDENKNNHVIDPHTDGKTASELISYYNNPLQDLTKIDDELRKKNEDPTLKTNSYYQSTASLYNNRTQLASLGNGKADNFILCYPKENTLTDNSPLYYYATGVAIEGDYYKKEGNTYTKEHRVYYGFLRHRGEPMNSGETTYKIKALDGLSKELSNTVDVAMNFGIVRNNIYRISIDRITEKNELQLQIKVKKWDTFTHETIYM